MSSTTTTSSYLLVAAPQGVRGMHLLLSPDRLSVHQVTLPPTPAHRMLAALAGTLEEQLLDDPSDLHFALAPDSAAAMKAGRAFRVMVCDKTWLRGVLTKLAAEGHAITAILPMAKEDQLAGWNLAQFDFSTQPRMAAMLQGTASAAWRAPEWRWARIGLVVLLAIQIAGLNVWAWRERADLAAGREQINRLLTQTYPETQVVVDAPLQMAKALARDKAMRGSQDNQSLEAQLASKASTGKAYSQIDYINGELKLTEKTLDPQGGKP